MLAGWTHPFAPLGTPLVDRDDAGGRDRRLARSPRRRPGHAGADAAAAHSRAGRVRARARHGAERSRPRARAAFGQPPARAARSGRASATAISSTPSRPGRARNCAASAAGSKRSAPVTFDTVDTGGRRSPRRCRTFWCWRRAAGRAVAGTAIVNEPAISAFVQTRRHRPCGARPGADRPAAPRRQARSPRPSRCERRHRLVLEDRLQRGHVALLPRRAADARAHRQLARRPAHRPTSIPAPPPITR